MKTEWNLEYLYKSEEEREREFLFLTENMETFKEALVKFSLKPKDLLFLLEERFSLQLLIEKLYCYERRKTDLDNTNQKAKIKMNEVLKIYNTFLNLVSILEEKIIIEKDIFMKEDVLSFYTKYVLDILHRKTYIVKEDQRDLASYLDTQRYLITDLYRALIEKDSIESLVADENGKKIVLNAKRYNEYLRSKDRKVREEAFINYMKKYQKITNTMESIWNMKIQNEQSLIQTKNYQNLLEATLEENQFSSSMIENMIEIVYKNISLKEQYLEIRKRELKIDKLHIYDLDVPLVDDAFKKYTLEEATILIKKSLSLFGDDYTNIIDKALEEGWIDIYEKENKRKDSFSAISYAGVPYTLVNFHGNIKSVRILTHEMGHMMNTWYAKQRPFVYFEYSLFLAEIASKVHELLLNKTMVESASSTEEKAYILENNIQNLCFSLFNQTMLTEFEHTYIKQRENENSKKANELYLEIYKKYNKNLEIDSSIQYNWEGVTHFFVYHSYYMWNYVMGCAIASFIVYKLEQDKTFKNQYIEFLSVGKSKSTIEALKILDIDLEMGTYLEYAFTFLKQQINLLKEIKEKL